MAEICRRLDGLPLAIELAAAKIKLFSPKALLDRLELRLPLLSGGARDLPARQQALRDTVAWSYELLGRRAGAVRATRGLRGRLFPGGGWRPSGRRHAEEGSTGDPGLPGGQQPGRVAGRSRLRAWGDEPRFMMLETVREYAAERLDSDGEAEEVHRAHAMYYLELAEAAQRRFLQTLTGWLVVRRGHDNMRAALRWTIRHRRVDIGTRLALALWRFWPERYHITEGRRWLEAVLALGQPEGGVAEPTLSARRWAFLHLVAGMLASGRGDHERAVDLYEQSLTLYRTMGHRKGTSGPLRELGVAAHHRGDYERAAHLSEQALAISREFGSAFGAGLAVCPCQALARAGASNGPGYCWKRAQPRYGGQNILCASPTRSPSRFPGGSLECQVGRAERASELFKESLRLAQRFGFTFDAVICLGGMARVEAMQDRPKRAARLLGASAAQRERSERSFRPLVTRITTTRRKPAAALGERVFDAAWAAGQSMSLEEVITEVVGEEG